MSLSTLNLGLSSTGECAGFTTPEIPGAKVLSLASHFVQDLAFPSTIPDLPPNLPPLSFCNVSIALTHPGDDDTVFITVALPPSSAWNGRYQATGGGGLAAGYDYSMAGPIATGFASSSTDGGLTLGHTINPQSEIWGMDSDGQLNRALLLNLSWRSVHDMALASKDLINQFYGTNAQYSYFAGCSQGGRQGYAAAAYCPDDFDGVLAVSPGLSLEYVGSAAFWPVVVMRNEGEMVPSCVLEKFQAAAVDKCDRLDGVADSIISDPDVLLNCSFNPASLVDTVVSCGETGNIVITERQAKIVHKILEGPITPDGKPLWYGLPPGAAISDVTFDKDGALIPVPFARSASWLKYMIIRDPTRDVTNLTYEEYFKAFEASIIEGGPFLSTESINLNPFNAVGGKLLSWVGLADEYIHPSNVLKYHDQIAERLGSQQAANDFYRLFTAPGVAHCKGGPGPQPLNAMPALMKWVENGTAPETLPVQSVKGETRNLCLYPKKLSYHEGKGYGCEEHITSFKPRDDGELPRRLT
ncbi:Tannase/feruloyl esterase [Aspergillus californicus]